MGLSKDAQSLCAKNHYSHRNIPSCIYVGKLYEKIDANVIGEIVAAVFFKAPSSRWPKGTLELGRLVRAEDKTLPLTKLISLTVKQIKREKRYGLLVSYADSKQDHHGGVYQASSWEYHGERQDGAVEGYMIDGIYVPHRSAYVKWKTNNTKMLSKILKRPVEKVYSKAKHLYWKSLNKDGDELAKKLNLRSKPYPKPKPSSENKYDKYREQRKKGEG